MTETYEITLASTVTQGKDQLSTDLDGEIVLMSIENGAYFGFNKILSEIWNHIETPMTASDITDRIFEEYDVDLETCQKDVLKVLNDLQKDGLLEIVN